MALDVAILRSKFDALKISLNNIKVMADKEKHVNMVE
jgi:hypothetical protein